MLIGLNGAMGAGKNTVAQRLAVLHDGPVVEISYARKLKESVAVLFGVSLAYIEQAKNDPAARVFIYDRRGNGAEYSFRQFLQRYGTESHRDVLGQDIWLDAALPLDGDYSDALYVVTDVRFPNEKQRVEELDGLTVYVHGPNEAPAEHASEVPLQCDWHLYNTLRDDNFVALDRECRRLLEYVAEW